MNSSPPTVVDTAGGFPSPASIKATGHSGLLAYVSPSRPGTAFPGKPITRRVLDEYRAAGVPVAPVWQYGKPGEATPSDWTTGRAGGRRMARQALDTWFAAGGPGWTPIYFAVDEDLTLDQWNSTAVEFFRGCGDVLGPQWVGIYGHSRVCAWAAEDGVIGRTPDGRRWWAWQTRAWSGSEIAPEAVLYQRIIDTPNTPGPKVGGIVVDVNDVLAPDWGQTGIDRSPTGRDRLRPAFRDVDLLGPNNQGRGGASIVYFLLHTEEGSSTAENLVRSGNASGAFSYHYIVDDQTRVAMVDTDLASWSVLDANNRSINLCFAGSRAAQSRDEWLRRFRNAIRIAAWTVVEDAAKYPTLNPRAVQGRPYPLGDVPCVSDHYFVTKVLGIGDHTDVGPNFPWDVLAADLREFLDVVPGGVVPGGPGGPGEPGGVEPGGPPAPGEPDDETPGEPPPSWWSRRWNDGRELLTGAFGRLRRLLPD
ncbi:MAG: DUF1906 domain-containing protein [Gordonia sp. (in: high G+C Gram-positive bacteria)]